MSTAFERNLNAGIVIRRNRFIHTRSFVVVRFGCYIYIAHYQYRLGCAAAKLPKRWLNTWNFVVEVVRCLWYGFKREYFRISAREAECNGPSIISSNRITCTWVTTVALSLPSSVSSIFDTLIFDFKSFSVSPTKSTPCL